MNEIIESIIKWCNENDYHGVNIRIGYFMGEIFLNLKLFLNDKCIDHEFYIGGTLNVNNWQEYRNDLELNEFLKEADKKLKGENK